MMKKTLFFLPLLLLLTVYACQDDDDVQDPGNIDVTVDFRAVYDGSDLAIQSVAYDYPTGAELKVGLFQYYVSDLSLVATDGSLVSLSEIELIRYGDATGDATESRTFTVPEGDYSGLRFGLGVKPELNAQPPSNFSAADPLNENEFWNDNARYVFAKIEANADLDNNGMFDTGLTYHMGSDALYTTLDFTAVDGFTLNGSASDPRLVITADVLSALSSDGATFDIANPDQQRVHGGNQVIAQDIWDRFVGQFSLQLQ